MTFLADHRYTDDELRDLVRRLAAPYAVTSGSGSKKSRTANVPGSVGWCRVNNVNRGHLTSFMSGHRGPPADLLDALGLERAIVWKKR